MSEITPHVATELQSYCLNPTDQLAILLLRKYLNSISTQVSHDFLATSYNLQGISSSLHLTVEGGGEAYGDSVPAIFFHPHVTSF